MRSRITPARVTGAMALVVVLLLVSIPVFFAPVLPARAVEFLQVGHWVFNQATRTAFHVHGGSKEVDAKIALPAVGQGGAVVQGEAYGFVVDGRTVVGFGKSTLTVGGVIPTGLAEQPLGLEVPGGPYLIYRRAGSIVRLGLPAATIPGGGPISSAVATTDGTVWVRRADTGQICRLGAADAGVRCAVAVTGAPSGVLTVAGGRPGLFDPAAGTLALIDGDALAAPVRVADPLPPGTEVAANDAAGRLPVLAPGGRLLLVDTSWVAAPGRPAGGPVTVPLGAGRYRSPVATDDAVAVLDLTRSRVLTFGRDGSRRRAAPVAAPAASARVVRGGDGKVYVDDATGAHTLVVDPDGAMTTVRLSGTDVPTTPPRRPEPPVTDRDRDRDRPRSADEPARAGTRGGGATTKGRRDTPATVPGSPAPVLGRPGNAEVTVSWRKAAANGAAVLAYDVTWTAADGSPGGAVSVPGGNRTTLVPGLDNGTAYTFAVAARNSVGAGPAAVSAAVTPSSDVPSAPTGVTASAGTDGTLAVTWAEADGQGNTVTGYEVTAHGDDDSQAVVGAPTGTTVTLTAGAGITLGVTYTFTVTATNDKGLVSDPSEASNAVAAYGPAAAPGDLRAEVANRAVTLTWAEPDLGGGALVGYLVDGDGVAPRTVTERSARFDELANGREHRFSVRAVTRSRADNGSATVEGAAASVTGTPGTAPAVDLVSVEATGDRAVTVRVVVDERDSGGVTCLVTLNGAERWRGGCAGARDIRIDGLDYATVYNAQVHGSNAFGNAPGTQIMGARTNDPPRTVEVGRGARVNRAECNTPACAWVTVAARNFAPNTTFTFVCRASGEEGGFYTFTARTDGNGSATVNSGRCFYGFPGRDVWMTVGGVESNHYRW